MNPLLTGRGSIASTLACWNDTGLPTRGFRERSKPGCAASKKCDSRQKHHHRRKWRSTLLEDDREKCSCAKQQRRPLANLKFFAHRKSLCSARKRHNGALNCDPATLVATLALAGRSAEISLLTRFIPQGLSRVSSPNTPAHFDFHPSFPVNFPTRTERAGSPPQNASLALRTFGPIYSRKRRQDVNEPPVLRCRSGCCCPQCILSFIN